jgi:hypothetical protein
MVTQALTALGMRGTSIVPSKFDWLFGGSASTSGVFSGTIDGMQTWAEVHFLATTVDGITACTGRAGSGEATFTVGVKGRPQTLGGGSVTGSLSGAGPLYFASNERIFVMTPDARLRDGLQSVLGLSVPNCVWREPETLPTLPWEREIVDALHVGGVDVGLIGGSKFETFLGDRRDARVFIKPAGQAGGAEVLSLTTPLREIRMCSTSSAPGFTKWTVVVDGQNLPGMEGSMSAYPLFGPRFFVIAWDVDSATALSTGLGLSAPPC